MEGVTDGKRLGKERSRGKYIGRRRIERNGEDWGRGWKGWKRDWVIRDEQEEKRFGDGG